MSEPTSTAPTIGKDSDFSRRLVRGIRTLDPRQELKRLSEGQIPCSRKSLLLGMATGAGFLGIGLAARRGVKTSANWSVASFCVVSIGTFQICRSNLAAERRRMKTIIDGFAGRKGRALQAAEAKSETSELGIAQVS